MSAELATDLPEAGRSADASFRGRRSGGGRRPRRSGRDLLLDGAVILGLAGLAVTQPLLDLFGQNPTFFVAGGYGRRQIVAFALVIAAVPALAVWLATSLPGLVHRTAGVIAHAVGVAVLGGMLGLLVGRSLGLDGVVSLFGFASLVAVTAAWAEQRWRPARQFLGLLAVGNVAFLVLFLVASPTSDLLRGQPVGDVGEVSVPPLSGPVSVVVLDEFPLSTIVRPDGTINEVRYPNLAALAEESTWFRNAASESAETYESVPSILTGRLGDEGDLPVLSEHPRNLFTLLGPSYPVHRYEAVTDLCPPELCEPPPAEPLAQALDDARVVYGHEVLPRALRDDLPRADQGWGNFDAGTPTAEGSGGPPVDADADADPLARMRAMEPEELSRNGQAANLTAQYRLLGPEPSVNFTHVLLPHSPYVLTPWGTTAVDTRAVPDVPEPGEPGYERAFDELFALHSLQAGAVDRLVGDMVDQLKRSGAWDDMTFVLVADHGMDLTAPVAGGDYRADAADEWLRIPFFVKAPGQTEGEVRDEPASTIDVLPSLVDLLDIETDWTFDGHSLFDGSEPRADRLLAPGVEGLYEVAAGLEARFPHGAGWDALAAIGEHGGLVGTDVDDWEVGEPSRLAWTFDQRQAIEDPASTGGRVPVWVTGTVSGTRDEPGDLVVAVDGTIAGTVGGYRRSGDGWAFSGILGRPAAGGGAREVVAYEVVRADGREVLRPVGDT